LSRICLSKLKKSSMACRRKKREPLAFKNPNPTWVMAELEKLYKEWEEWEEWAEYAPTIKGRPYDRNTHADCFANGVENIDKHDILCEKTLTFLDNNVQGHNFMFLNEYEEPHDDNLDQLHVKIPHRIKELEILRESLEYAIVPE